MRLLKWWETPEQTEAGFTYQLIVESKPRDNGFRIEGRFLGGGCGLDSFSISEDREEETPGIFDMVRELFWRIQDLPNMLPLIRRMWSLEYADYDSARESNPDITDDLEACRELTCDPSFGEIIGEEQYNQNIDALDTVFSCDRGDQEEKADPFFIPKVGPQLELFG